MTEPKPEVGQRWRWSKPDSIGQRLTVEVVTSSPYVTAEIVQTALSNVDSFVIGNRFPMIMGNWEFLPGQDKPRDD